MATATFDTLGFSRKLNLAGIPEAHADAIADALRDTLSESITDTLSTKADLSAVKAELKAEMSELKFDVIKWMVGLSIAQFSLLAGILIKLL